MAIFKKKKDEQQKINVCQGITLSEAVQMTRMAGYQEVLVRGILEVLIVFGSVGGILSCVGLNYHMLVLFLADAVIAAYFSNLFRTGKIWLRDIGYVSYFIVFILAIFLLKSYANSGFYAMVNEFLNKITDYFMVDDVKVFSESMGNRAVTVPIAAIFVSSIEIIVLNIFLSTYMSIAAAVLMGVPVFILPLFFRLEPDVLYVILLCAGIFGVIVLKGSRHYKLVFDDRQFDTIEKKGRLKTIGYTQSGKIAAQITGVLLGIILLVLGVVNVAYPPDNFTYRFKNSTVKEKIEEPLGNLIMYGFEALRNRPNTGGIAEGQLGGVSSVITDGETDLELIFTPYSTDTIYLKAFVGDRYSVDHWEKDEGGMYPLPRVTDNNTKGENKVAEPDEAAGEAKSIESGRTIDKNGTPVLDKTDDAAHGKMDVVNISANPNYYYMPYYTLWDSDMESGYKNKNGIQRGQTQTYIYYPDYSYEADNNGQIKESYLEVPEENREVIAEFCREAGFGGSDEEIVQQVTAYFEENFPYTIHPGATPSGEDYVNYFLTKTKKGLCAHFASAATLIFRYYGIPARYCEGYAVDYNGVLDGKLFNEYHGDKVNGNRKEYDDYFTGENLLGRTDVMVVDVTDESAHAWVEVFIDGKWQVAETTPPAGEEEEQDDFWTRFGQYFFGDGEDDTQNYGAVDTSAIFSMENVRWVVMILAGIVAVAVLIFVIKLMSRKIKRMLSYHTDFVGDDVIAYYSYMCDYMRLARVGFDDADTHLKQSKLMLTRRGERVEDISPDRMSNALAISETVEELSYDNGIDMMSESLLDESARILDILKGVMVFIKKNTDKKKRIYAFFKL